MTTKATTIRLPDPTLRQLDELAEQYGTRTAAIAVAIDRLYEEAAMNAPQSFVRVVNGIRYDASKAVLIASDRYWDGHNFERSGRNTYLYRTPKGRYFTATFTQWQGERDRIGPVSPDMAMELYEGPLTEHEVDHATAFPDADTEDA